MRARARALPSLGRSDPTTYFAGTADGALHRCSCSYTEQSLEVLGGHGGPLLRVRCSPFPTAAAAGTAGGAVLSCSADWTVKLWDPKRPQAVATFHSGAQPPPPPPSHADTRVRVMVRAAMACALLCCFLCVRVCVRARVCARARVPSLLRQGT